jgi:MoxR-like ATPase
VARTNERPNLYAGRCLYCLEMVGAQEGWVFDDLARNKRNVVRHGRCNEAVERARLQELTEALGAPATSAWDAAANGKAAPSRKPTLDEAFEAGVKAEAFPEAEELDAMLSHALSEAVDAISERTAESWMTKVPAMVEELLSAHRPVNITVGDMPSVDMGTTHAALEDVLLMVVAGTSPFLVGPAGSGKTTLAEQVAKALGRKFYMAARVTSEYKLVGFVDAHGNTVRTQFREAYEHGGIFLFDEVDASDPDALTAFNAALANGFGDFPDGMVSRHAEFAAIAAGNTFGRGADRQYVGRNQLDAATLDRFQVYEVEYDEALELKLAGCDPWVRYVQAIRKGVEAAKVRHVVSPRASIAGAKLIAAGLSLPKVIEATIWKGLDASNKARVVNEGAASDISAAHQALLRWVAGRTEEEAA